MSVALKRDTVGQAGADTVTENVLFFLCAHSLYVFKVPLLHVTVLPHRKNEIKLDHKSWQKMSSKSYELHVQHKPLFTQYDPELRPTQCTVMSFKDCLSAGIRWCSQPLNCALPLLGYGLQ